MPIQKGKKRKRPRTRTGRGVYDPAEENEEQTVTPAPQRQRVRRRGWTPPWWVNAGFGGMMLILGVSFSLIFQRSESPSIRIGLLVAYCALGGFYLARAYRQYRARGEG